MADNLYRIEVVGHDGQRSPYNLPEIDTVGMLMTNEELAYVKLHKVRINATAKAKEAKMYWRHDAPGRQTLCCTACDLPCSGMEETKYCNKCGAKFL